MTVVLTAIMANGLRRSQIAGRFTLSHRGGPKVRLRLCWFAAVVALFLQSLPTQAQGTDSNPAATLIEDCLSADAERAVSRLECVDPEQFGQIEHFRELLEVSKSAPEERALRANLVVASKIAACINDFRLFPESSEALTDFHCLQARLLHFYEETGKYITESDLRFQDRLAYASSKVHFCMIDEDLPVMQCISMIESALAEYGLVFSQLADQNGAKETGLRRSGDASEEATAPGLPELEQFLDLSLENANRFPTLFAQQFGAVLGPALCKAYEQFPKARNRLAFLYNVLIRFDFGNLAATSRLHQFLNQLVEDFRSEPGTPSYLGFDPPDWSTSEDPCGEEEWRLEFPSFVVAPGHRLPPTAELRIRLERLQSMLLEVSRASGERTHLWKPFVRYGELLLDLADRMRDSSLRSPGGWHARHMLMERARDAFLLRGVDPGKYPRELNVLSAPISRQIDSYGSELMNGLYLERLIDFAEGYLEYGEAILSSAQKQRLHEFLAIAYRLTGDQLSSLSHLQQCDLKPSQFDERLTFYRQKGVPVPPNSSGASKSQ